MYASRRCFLERLLVSPNLLGRKKGPRLATGGIGHAMSRRTNRHAKVDHCDLLDRLGQSPGDRKRECGRAARRGRCTGCIAERPRPAQGGAHRSFRWRDRCRSGHRDSHPFRPADEPDKARARVGPERRWLPTSGRYKSTRPERHEVWSSPCNLPQERSIRSKPAESNPSGQALSRDSSRLTTSWRNRSLGRLAQRNR